MPSEMKEPFVAKMTALLTEAGLDAVAIYKLVEKISEWHDLAYKLGVKAGNEHAVLTGE